jgi:hypothetical protein
MTRPRWLWWLDAPVQGVLCRHEWLRKTAGRRLYLVCVHCKKETAGIRVGAARPTPRTVSRV